MNNILTASRLGSLLRCPRQHYWRYEVGLISNSDTHALRFGSAWAKLMEARWLGMDFPAALAKATEGAELDELTLATLSGLGAGYFKHYGSEGFIKEVYPEVEFSQPLAGSRTFTVAGKMDGCCVLYDNRTALKEDKTTGDSLDPDSDYWLRLRFNSQLFQYVLAARPMGWDFATIVYDVSRRPAIEPKQVNVLDDQGRKIVNDASGNRVFKKNGEPRESGSTADGYTLQTRVETCEEYSQRLFADTQARPDFYFARREVPIIEADLEEFREQRLTLSRLILHCRQTGKRFAERAERAWPRNVDKMVCTGCAYQSFCLQNIHPDLNHPPAGFRVGNPSPELNAVDSTHVTN